MERRKPVAEFVHIEKTAGTSVRAAVEHHVGSDHVYVYSPDANRLTKASDKLKPVTSPLLDKVREGFSNPILGPLYMLVYPRISNRYKDRIRNNAPELKIKDDTKVIFGHFAADLFDEQLQGEPIRGVILRDPLERMRSHYDHWKRTYANEDWRIHIPFDKKMTFEKFASLDATRNWQTKALAGRNLASFDVVGVTEYTEEFIQTFLQRLTSEGLTLPNIEQHAELKRYNTTPPKRRTNISEIDPKYLEKFRKDHAEDYSSYHQAKKIQEARMHS